MREAPRHLGPYFVPLYRPDKGGVDFLGMRQVNLDMMQGCLPGINNVTWYLRPFSMVSWMYWKFHLLAAAAGIQQPSKKQLAAWTEKAETLFTWGHKLNSVSNIPGSSFDPPGSGSAPLDFESWHRAAVNTSLMAAIQYGPSSKTLDGLGFLEPLYGPFFKTVNEGVELAEALDERIQKVDLSGLLADLKPHEGSANQARQMYQAWSVATPSKRERAAFRRAFYDSDAVGRADAIGLRSTTVAMILRLFARASKPVTVDEMRDFLFHGRLSAAGPRFKDERIISAWTRWIVLQVRQIQRLAMEGLLSWFESRLALANEKTTEAIVQSTMKMLEQHADVFPSNGPVGEVFAQLQGEGTSLEDLLRRSEQQPDCNPFTSMQTIMPAILNGDSELPALCLRTLFLSLQFCTAFEQDRVARSLTGLGNAERLSLKHSLDTLNRCQDWRFSDFLRILFENLILSQHFSVAARRFDGQTQRLRISIEEDGLEFLADAPLIPTITQDRLATAMALMADCGLIRWDANAGAYGAV